MIKKLKKGFTLVELIVVIAIIAILSTVAIIGFTRGVDKANVSNDTQLVRNLNERMQLEEAATGYKKPETAHEAFILTEDFGFIIEKLTPTSSGNDIVWDMTTNRFALIDATDHTVVYTDPQVKIETDELHKLWKVFKEVPSDSKYSIYLAGENFTSPITTSVGLDVGKNLGITAINYTNTSGNSKNVVIRTNGQVLTVNAPNDTVTHYGFATIVNVEDVKVGTYNEAGTVGRLVYSDNEGAIIFKSTAVVYCYMNTSTDSSADATDTTKEQGAVVYTNVNSSDKTNAYGYVEGKIPVTVANGIVEVHSCPNHNIDYGVVVVGTREYIICKCCGGFTLFEDGNKVELDANDPRKSVEISSASSSHFDYTSPNHEHSYSDAWSHDEANHWHICEGCDEISSLAKHTITYSNNTGDTHDESCTVCGYSRTGVAHTFGNGVCACGKEEVTAPVEVHLTGVVGYANKSDHYTDSNALIGTHWSDDDKISYYNSFKLLQHYLTVTYTIPSDTPANATIICDPVTEWNEKIKDIAPGQALAFTYKIVNNSSHSFDIKQTDVHSDVVEAISKSNAIVKVVNDYKVLKNDGTYFDLDQSYIPYMTKCSYFNNYITWLKNSGATTQSSATPTFMGEYYNTFANSSDKSFYYYLDTEVVQKGTSWDAVLDVLCGTPDWFANNIDYNSNKAQYVECELIRLMMKFSYEKAFGFVFVQNTENDWQNGAYQKIYNNNSNLAIGTGFYGWDTYDPTTLKAYNFLELCEDGATLNYLKNGNTISGGIACLWHAYAGNAWQNVTLCDAPQFTIVLEAN
jgi:prepilin-type N-terminal cleavage/methylation domain-containing protein